MIRAPGTRSEAYWIPAVYLLLLAGLYYSSLQWLVVKDWNREDFNYAYLIPAVVLYLLWEKRAPLRGTPSTPSWLGITPIAAGLLLFWLGELAGEYFSIYLSLWLLVLGACWLHLGWHKLKIIGFPLFLCLTMFPPPVFLFQKITFTLKLISSKLGVDMMQAFGMTAFREGNIIDLGFTQLQVVDACSGLRYLIPLIVLGLLLAYFFKGAFWKKIVLVIFAIPLTVFTNSLRIALTGLLSEVWGPEVAEGFFHGFSGWFIFMFSFVVMLGVMWGLNLIPSAKKPDKNKYDGENVKNKKTIIESTENTDLRVADDSGTISNRIPHFTRFSVVGSLLLVSLVFYQTVDFREKVPSTQSFDQFPITFGNWQGQLQTMPQEFIDTLDFSDYAIIDYHNPGGQSVNFYVAYYESQAKGESIHSPETCLPGSGWEFHQAGGVEVPLPNTSDREIRVNRAVMVKFGYRQLSYYWFPMRGRVLTNAYQMKWYTFWDALTRQRTDGALVRLITPIAKDETIQDADARLQAFTRELVPVLNDYLPQ